MSQSRELQLHIVNITEINYSKAWGPPQFQEKRSRSEKAILGALREFRGILGAALGIRTSILGIRNSILGMASHDLSNTKTTILGATPGAIPGIDGNPHERFSFAPYSRGFFSRIGVVPARKNYKRPQTNPRMSLGTPKSTVPNNIAKRPSQTRRRTNVQQLTCKIDLPFSFYLFFSFVLLEPKPFVLKGKALGEK